MSAFDPKRTSVPPKYVEIVLRLGAKGSDDHALLSFIARAIRAGGDACHAGRGPGSAIVDAGGWALLPGRPKCRLHHSRFPVDAVPLHSHTPQEREAYAGALNTVGLNVGISAGGVLGWAVFAPTAGLPLGALAGEYVGVSGDVGIGLGAGANVLLGGSNRTVALQPISLQGSIALNVVAGVSSLKLRPLPM